jgi:hypothetical protein
MSGRSLFVLWNDAMRARAIEMIRLCPKESRCEIRGPRRTNDQNAKMWAMLTEIADQLPWHGVKLDADDWKLIFLDSLKRELRLVPNLDGDGFVNLGRSSSDLSKEEMADMISLIDSFAANHGVKFHGPGDEEAP